MQIFQVSNKNANIHFSVFANTNTREYLAPSLIVATEDKIARQMWQYINGYNKKVRLYISVKCFYYIMM